MRLTNKEDNYPSTVLFDGDVICYRAGYMAQAKNELKPLKYAVIIVRSIIRKVLKDLNTFDYNIYLSPQTNFRNTLYPDYKANRDKSKRPVHYESIREYLIHKHKAIICNDIEADDMLGIVQTKYGDSTCIASVDKDLLQIPGWHYNLNTHKLDFVTDPGELWIERRGTKNTAHLKGYGKKWFWAQMLTGDKIDNVLKITGQKLGPVKVHSLLANLDLDQCEKVVKSLYLEHSDLQHYQKNTTLLHIRRYSEEGV